MEEGTILAWKVKPGDAIALGQVICEIETDKATLEYESPAAGRLARIVVADGESIAVKQPIAFLADSDAAVDAYLAGGGNTAPTTQAAPRPVATSSAMAATTTVAQPASTGRIVTIPVGRSSGG